MPREVNQKNYYQGPDNGAIYYQGENECSICITQTDVVALENDIIDDNGHLIWICKDCLKKALEALK
ncbi:MAG: hypothetical protein GY853_14150 [PVC group bacterium]|nr:hypothetical protein [PVC group bacterium]